MYVVSSISLLTCRTEIPTAVQLTPAVKVKSRPMRTEPVRLPLNATALVALTTHIICGSTQRAGAHNMSMRHYCACGMRGLCGGVCSKWCQIGPPIAARRTSRMLPMQLLGRFAFSLLSCRFGKLLCSKPWLPVQQPTPLPPPTNALHAAACCVAGLP